MKALDKLSRGIAKAAKWLLHSLPDAGQPKLPLAIALCYSNGAWWLERTDRVVLAWWSWSQEPPPGMPEEIRGQIAQRGDEMLVRCDGVIVAHGSADGQRWRIDEDGCRALSELYGLDYGCCVAWIEADQHWAVLNDEGKILKRFVQYEQAQEFAANLEASWK